MLHFVYHIKHFIKQLDVYAKKDMFFIQISQKIYLLNFGVICLTALHINLHFQTVFRGSNAK